MKKKIQSFLFEIFMLINMFLWYDLFFRILLRGKLEGKENLPQSGFIVAANHVSYLDWIILYTLFRKEFNIRISFLGKAKLSKNPLFKCYLDFGNTIMVDYSKVSSVKNAYAKMNSMVQEGNVVGIFPEGTRSGDGRILPGNEGIGGMVLNANAPVIPVGLCGFYNVWPNNKLFPRLAKCKVKIGAPIHFDMNMSSNRRESRKLVTHIIMKEIAALTDDKYNHIPSEIEDEYHSFLVEEEAMA